MLTIMYITFVVEYTKLTYPLGPVQAFLRARIPNSAAQSAMMTTIRATEQMMMATILPTWLRRRHLSSWNLSQPRNWNPDVPSQHLRPPTLFLPLFLVDKKCENISRWRSVNKCSMLMLSLISGGSIYTNVAWKFLTARFGVIMMTGHV